MSHEAEAALTVVRAAPINANYAVKSLRKPLVNEDSMSCRSFARRLPYFDAAHVDRQHQLVTRMRKFVGSYAVSPLSQARLPDNDTCQSGGGKRRTG